jgi:hypothetical protein
MFDKMSAIKETAKFWGVLDLLSVFWYFGWNVAHGYIPVLNDIEKVSKNINSFGLPEYKFFSYVSVLIYLSTILSGMLLVFQKKSGLIISYIQTPFRLITIIPPSIFFILWPLKSIFEIPPLWLGVALIIFSETLKISTLILWNKRRST